ncbi:hypothetical protein [Pontivivens ytuae]|nr:hypothetical protein [Pontivivens ytuae]
MATAGWFLAFAIYERQAMLNLVPEMLSGTGITHTIVTRSAPWPILFSDEEAQWHLRLSSDTATAEATRALGLRPADASDTAFYRGAFAGFFPRVDPTQFADAVVYRGDLARSAGWVCTPYCGSVAVVTGRDLFMTAYAF